MSRYRCPSCGSKRLEATFDYLHDLTIIRCADCMEYYCTSNCDLHNLGADVVIIEWHRSFHAQKRIGAVV